MKSVLGKERMWIYVVVCCCSLAIGRFLRTDCGSLVHWRMSVSTRSTASSARQPMETRRDFGQFPTGCGRLQAFARCGWGRGRCRL